MKFYLFVIVLFITAEIFPQSDSTDAEFESFTARLNNKLLLVVSNEGDTLYSKVFKNPEFTTSDLDSDGVEEYIIVDYKEIDDKNDFTLFVYNTLDTFYCVDSIHSGYIEPYIVYSTDAESNVIVAGIPQFNELNNGKEESSLPINVWKYEEAALTIVNNEIYELFETETGSIIDYLEDYFDSNIENCQSSQQVNNIIASGYINLVNAGENSVASQFLKKYYLCPDIESYKLKIENLLKVNK
jgi:hypothetical protein